MDKKLGLNSGTSERLIKFVKKDRPGHDLHYAIDSSKINNQLSWSATETLENGISKTIEWYLKNQKWLENIISGDYRDYYAKQYTTL